MQKIFTSFILYFSFSTFLLPWISIGNIAGFEIRTFHALIVIPIIHWKSFFKIIFSVVKRFRSFFLAFALLIIFFFAAILWSNNLQNAFVVLTKNIIYFVIFLSVLYVFIYSKIYDQYVSLYKILVFSLVCFLSYNIILSIVLGQNLLWQAITYVFTGNVHDLNYSYFTTLLNFNPTAGAIYTRADAAFITPTFRNTLGEGLVILLLVLIEKKKKSNLTLKFYIVIVILLLLISQSRSSFLVVILILSIFYTYRYKAKTIIIIPPFLIILLLILIYSDLAIVERFRSLGDDRRIAMFLDALRLIGDSPILGYGIGSEITSGTKELSIHNIFLSFWYEIGLLGLFGSIIFFAVLTIYLFKYNRFISIDGSILLLVPIMPLIRMLVSGGNSLLSFQNWVAIALYFSTVLYVKDVVRKQYINRKKDFKGGVKGGETKH